MGRNLKYRSMITWLYSSSPRDKTKSVHGVNRHSCTMEVFPLLYLQGKESGISCDAVPAISQTLAHTPDLEGVYGYNDKEKLFKNRPELNLKI